MQGMSKRDDCYLRGLLIHGTRSTLRCCKRKTDRQSQWAQDTLHRLGANGELFNDTIGKTVS